MTRSEIIEEYWDEFLEWCQKERLFADDDDFLESVMVNMATSPTEENFWKWYMNERPND